MTNSTTMTKYLLVFLLLPLQIFVQPFSQTEIKRMKQKSQPVTIIRDNCGIPQKILDKIFQPFFTTKPTGQGTGLGLSLSYDIVKAHGGELKVETRESEGSTFVISLPAEISRA